MIPLGIVLERRRSATGARPAPRAAHRLQQSASTSASSSCVLALTIVNMLIVSLAAYRAVEYMDSTAFCGQVCHTVMEPEFVAHHDGPHSRVTCVECHVGSGAQSYVYSKLTDSRQLSHLVQNSYPRPIPSPVHNLRPAREHLRAVPLAREVPRRQGRDHSRRTRTTSRTPSSPTRLLLHVGGGMPQFGLGAGIHWHMNPHNEIEYIATDDKRQEIP